MTTTTTSQTHRTVPLISSDTAGPLGAIHLPRLWAKLTLASTGRLADGYDECGPGFDQMTLNNLNLNRDETIAYIRDNSPTYMEFERWVVEKNGGNIDKERIRKHNEAVRGYCHDDDKARGMRSSSGIHHEHIKDAVTLNTIEDLDELHHQATAKA
ncbi:MAG: DUF5069 domain-containing protein [Candidatus Eremiobacteraeota bacterium]|nr:DUF5069 domain-containing protein [Candidatus Eremiobacteraeota bacterium]